ncbi:class I SAM-dependent methyltransferase [Microbispora hainanensis]|uniref:Class I SAM-dependent methyltransferase n=1 Tax=Microbispora hainanensis TaxID=568844 RepID=A0A544YN07_9ACTN|nr:class I SAM-dependent methyltransferase [Microbispora hainanensis]
MTPPELVALIEGHSERDGERDGEGNAAGNGRAHGAGDGGAENGRADGARDGGAGNGALPPGRALELGCGTGTGTNAVYLARHGWEVVAVDLVDRAIEEARVRADAAGVAVRLLQGDVTRLDELDAPGPYDLFFDLSCFCGIPPHRRDAYAAGLTRRAAPGSRLLMFGYGPGTLGDTFSGVTADELRARFEGWELVDVTPGTNPFPTFWFTLQAGNA